MEVDVANQIPVVNSRRYTIDTYPLPRESPNKFTKFQKFMHKKKLNLYHPPPPPTSGIKTLVLDLDETLIHSSQFPPHPSVKYFMIKDDSIQINDENLNSPAEQDSETQAFPPLYIYMRPGLEDFINFAKENFEVFVYTYAERDYAEPILDYIFPELDENHRLYRDSCIKATKSSVSAYYSSASKAHKKADSLSGEKKYKVSKSKIKSKGIIKDLVMLDRSISDIIFVDDNDYQAIRVNNNNTIVIPTWKGMPNDTALTSWLKPILNNCMSSNDVRDVISNISNKVRRFTL